MKRLLILGMLVGLPGIVSASLLISEVAWMGTAISANDEWIELFNSSEEKILVDGWVLGDGEGLVINLAGAVGAGQHVVLERTNDDSAPGAAFLLYTGSLKNNGATLTLTDAQGKVVDVVEGGNNWSLIGGNNKLKTTPQRTEAGSWMTAESTPGTALPEIAETSALFDQDVKTKIVSEKSEHTTSSSSMNAAVIESGTSTVNWPYVALVAFLVICVLGVYSNSTKNY